MSGRRSLRPLAVLAALALCAALGASGAFAGDPSPATAGAKAQKSTLLTTAAPVDASSNANYLATADQARKAADVLAAEIPLPEGGNFNGIRWEDVPDGISESSLKDVLHHNAWCQWTRALADGREAGTARQVLRDFPRWPTIRGGTEAAQARAVADGGSAYPAHLDVCRETHERQVAYAKRQGLLPSR